jgi:hypothetical protein
LMAHLVVTHCLFNSGAVALIARKALPDLKDTIFKEIIEHIEEDLTEGKDYFVNQQKASIKFINGSEIISRSWSDKKYKKGRSLKISCLCIEEIVENNQEDKAAFDTLKARLRRLPKIKENFMICATNPDSPDHWVYKYFIEEKKKTRFVFYSRTEQNPFLDPIYINQLKEDLDPKEARRLLYGEWVDIDRERVYHNYDSDINFLKNKTYQIDCNYPIDIMHDFNIGKGKPMSLAVGQAIGNGRHIFGECHVDGARTHDIMEELAGTGIFEIQTRFRIFGDASGASNDTRSIKTDYDIIKKFLANYIRKNGTNLDFEFFVPMSNPPIRRRHNLMNGLFKNENGVVSFFVYKGCEWVDTGLRRTKPLKGSLFTEDDTLPEQHVTTAIGYWCDYLRYKGTDHKTKSRQL